MKLSLDLFFLSFKCIPFCTKTEDQTLHKDTVGCIEVQKSGIFCNFLKFKMAHSSIFFCIQFRGAKTNAEFRPSIHFIKQRTRRPSFDSLPGPHHVSIGDLTMLRGNVVLMRGGPKIDTIHVTRPPLSNILSGNYQLVQTWLKKGV